VTTAPDVPRFDRICLAAGVVALIAASWAYLMYQDWAMRHMDLVDMAMPSAGPWSPADAVWVFAMWTIMMIAMMLPSATPLLNVYRRLVGAQEQRARPAVLTALFAGGYLLVWIGFSAIATLAQWGLHQAALLSPAMILTHSTVGAALFVVAGIYQWTPLKHSCLAKCGAPLDFLQRHWRGGGAGAFSMGALQGVYCIGCCWLLMALLFVYGVMNLVWIVAIALYVLLEKLLPLGRWLPRATGLALVAWGLWVALASPS
jgi:predicted metal-binding membrane protein